MKEDVQEKLLFASAGFSSSSAALQTVGVGLVNLLATFLGMSLIDKLGRKTLLPIGAPDMSAFRRYWKH